MSEPFALWQAVGVEIEYAIVDAATLDVRAVADRLLGAAGAGAGEEAGPGDVERGGIAWSNELALHVIEMKTAEPAPGFAGLAAAFQESVAEITRLLRELDARLLPGGMHPWMAPDRELRLWPHEYTDVYRAFDRIFGCRGHGWANLQSTHVNLPFRGDREFAVLHEAIRLVLPLVPALAASSPVLDGRLGPALDNRLLAYRDNARAVPSVCAGVIPERTGSPAEYRERILERIYRDMEALDPDGVLRHEWVNARGAIARFDRGAIEIRVIDCQECVAADVAVAAAVTGAVRALAEGGGPTPHDDTLRDVLDGTIRRGREALVQDDAYLERLGWPTGGPVPAGEIWERLAGGVLADGSLPELHAPLATVLREGPLAERIVRALGPGPSRRRMVEVWEELCDCVEAGASFRG